MAISLDGLRAPWGAYHVAERALAHEGGRDGAPMGVTVDRASGAALA
jgi:hypothetical protein